MYIFGLSVCSSLEIEFPQNNSPFCKNDIWFKLLRAECVRSYPSPLSSDALSAWGAAGTARENNLEVKKASLWLREVLVPQAALEIERAVKEGANSTFRVRTVLHRYKNEEEESFFEKKKIEKKEWCQYATFGFGPQAHRSSCCSGCYYV